MDSEYEKIVFKFFSDIFEEEMIETMWGKIINKGKGLYQIDNIPFYAPFVASDDIIFAEYDDTEQRLIYKKTIEYSGNSLVQIVIMNDSTETNEIRKTFEELGCKSEKAKEGYFSMEILYMTNYLPIKIKLDELESNNIIGYAEPCLSNKHRNDLELNQ